MARPEPTKTTLVPMTDLSLADSGASAASEDEAIDFRRWIDGVRRRWWMIAISVVVLTAAATLYAMNKPKLYKTSAAMVVKSRTPNVLSGVAEVVPVSAGGWYVAKDFYQREYKVMRSRKVARRAAELMQTERFGAHSFADLADLADAVYGKYDIIPDNEAPGYVMVQVINTDPTFAANLATAVALAYEENNLDTRVEGTRDATTWLTLQSRELKEKLEASEDRLYQFMEDNNVLSASMTSQQREVAQRLESFNTRLADAEADSIRFSVSFRALAEARDNPALLDTLSEVQDAAAIVSIKERLLEARSRKSELAGRYKEKHPQMVAATQQIETLEKALQKEIDTVLVALERKKKTIDASVAGLKKAVDAEREREARLNKLSLDFRRLEREVHTNEKLFEMVTGRMKEADLSQALRFNNVRLLDEARVPEAPFKPSISRYAVLGGLAGFFLALFVALGLEFLDNSIKSQADVESELKIPFLGQVPLINEGEISEHSPSRDLIVMHSPKSQVAESVRFIRTNLMFMSSDKPLHTMTITSAMPRDGKTTVAISLATTMAQTGARTLLVDTDMRRPRLHRSFGVANSKGITSALLGELSLDDAIVHTDQENLDFLPCGPVPPNPAELFHTRRFADIVDRLKGKYDHVIFDSSPVGAVTDPVILSKHTDGVLLVLRANETPRAAARQSLRAIQDASGRVLGAVLNVVDVNARHYGGRVGYYYYDYSADDEK